jgi:hypothetical protein
MSDEGEVLTRLTARARALRESDWRGRAGQRFRKILDRLSAFAEQHDVRPKDLANEGIELGRRALQGRANKDLAAAVKDFAEAEQKKIDVELKRRSLESQVRKEEAEARLSELRVLDAELELLKKLKAADVVIRRDAEGNLTVLSGMRGCDLEELANPDSLATSTNPADRRNLSE